MIPVRLLVETFLTETFVNGGRGRFDRVEERVHLRPGLVSEGGQ